MIQLYLQSLIDCDINTFISQHRLISWIPLLRCRVLIISLFSLPCPAPVVLSLVAYQSSTALFPLMWTELEMAVTVMLLEDDGEAEDVGDY